MTNQGNRDRWLVVGDHRHEIYERSLIRSLRRIGVRASGLSYCGRPPLAPIERFSLMRPNPLFASYVERRIGRALQSERPTHVLVWRGEPVTGDAIDRLRSRGTGARWVYYSNDHLFAPEDGSRWRYVHGALSHYDDVLVYRDLDVKLVRERLGVESQVWLPAYDPEILGPRRELPMTERPFDVIFIGHHAHDGRADLLEALARSGARVVVYGPGWPPLRGAETRGAVRGRMYAEALRSARIALVLYSKRNHDEITRRCFEIPYVGTPMLALRTPTMEGLFRESREAEYFSSVEEAVTTCQRMLSDEDHLEGLAVAAARRVDQVGGSIDARSTELLLLGSVP